jgi:hypothetical protein
MLGFEAVSKTPNNIIRTGECVLNLPSMDQVDAINRLSMVTGSNPVPAGVALRGYRHHADKFGIAALTPVASESVAPPRGHQPARKRQIAGIEDAGFGAEELEQACCLFHGKARIGPLP